MGVLLILPLLASGFVLCLRDSIIFSKLHRYDGQLLYLLVTYQGMLCFFWATITVTFAALLLSHNWPSYCFHWLNGQAICLPAFNTDWLAWGGKEIMAVETSSPLHGQVYFFMSLVGLVTCAMPFVLAPLRFWRFRRRLKLTPDQAQIFLNIKAVEPLPMANMIASSMSTKDALMLTMTDRKVYVGLIQAIGSPTETTGALENFAIWPMTSGYRDKDTLKVVSTYTYPPFDQSVQPLVLRLDNVVSITHFDDEHRKKVIENAEKDAGSKSERFYWPIRAAELAATVILTLLITKSRRR
jgi:hypothetical protein